MIFIGVGHLIIAEMTVIYIHKCKHKKSLYYMNFYYVAKM